MSEIEDSDIAIIGMALRVPGAATPEKYWENLRGGVESLRQLSDEELLARGVSPGTLADPNYVKAAMMLDGIDRFDPEFFGFSAKEAAILDPQHRQFYEVSWEALERAGHSPELFDGAIGVFAGSGMAAYFANNILTNHELLDSVGLFLLRHTGNDKDFLATRVSYSFNLKGPSVNVQTACSTSLVAAHMAVQSLLSGECDMALAGGATIDLPHGVGYHYKEGEILSPDGHCRAFDHRSKGTVFGSGTGVVVLRRLADAIADGDHIHAVIKGSAVNNDGSGKVGYLAPSVEGQAAAVAEALAVADISADTLGYVECHGTGTPVGDPIEIAALTRAFRETTDRVGYCRVGSVKSNIGHLDTAAGVASLIKAALAVEYGEIPPTLNYEAPNPKIEFAGSPFAVASELRAWEGPGPRRAGINSLGVGGTNAFVILEQAPSVAGVRAAAAESLPASAPTAANAPQMLVLSARSRKALDAAAQRLAEWFDEHPEAPMGDVAWTLHRGRFGFDQRRVLAARTPGEAAALLRENNPRRVFTHTRELDRPSVVFMYPGGGAQYFRMGRGLYDTEAVFREHIDSGLAILASRFHADLRSVFFAEEGERERIDVELAKPSVQLPLTFLVEYALTKLWEHYGVKPAALIGHSMGENTAACIAGTISFVDALGLVLLRGQLMDEVPSGGMLSVPMPAHELQGLLGDELDLAAANSPALSIASGDVQKLDALARRLEAMGVESQRVKINIAAHSRLLEGILGRFRAYLESIELRPPELPIVSNRTGRWLDPADAQDPQYWVDHLRNTVLFADGISTLLEDDQRVFLEVGPGAILGSFTRQHPGAPAQRVLGSLRHPDDDIGDDAYFRSVIGRLWAVGVDADVGKIWDGPRQRVPLPTYAFQHASYWIEPGRLGERPSRDVARPMRIEERSQWLRQPQWIQQGFLPEPTPPCTWLVFLGREPVCETLVSRLRSDGHRVVCVTDGDTFARVADDAFTIAPEAGGVGYQELIDALVADELVPSRILHSWLLTQDRSFRPGSSFFHRNQEYGFYSLFHLARALGKAGIETPMHLCVIANGSQGITDEPVVYPDKATALGPCRVIPREYPNITCSFVDVCAGDAAPESGRSRREVQRQHATDKAIANLLVELAAPPATETVAWRNDVRWVSRIGRPAAGMLQPQPQPQRLRSRGVYMITGGLGGIGTALAEWLVQNYQARLVLIGRTPLPARADWDEWLAEHAAADPISRAIVTVRALEAQGGEVLACAADVTVAEQMRDALNEAEEKFGEVNGVFHAAGVIRDSLIALKSQRDIEEVFSAKVYGTLVLDELFAARSPDFMILFSSSSVFIAPQGQIDYVGANAFMNAFAQSRRSRRSYPVTAVNWGIWADVGMVAAAEQPAPDADLSRSTPLEVSYPLFDKRYTARDGVSQQHVLTGTLAANDDWIMNEHRLASGEALLPGTGYVELIRAALAESLGGDRAFTLTNLVFDNPLYVRDGQTRAFRVRLRSNGAQWQAEILAQVPEAAAAEAWKTCATASVAVESLAGETTICMEDVEARCKGALESAGGSTAIRTTQEAHLNFGPRWHVLRRLVLGEGEAVARLRLDGQFAPELEDFALHPGLLDIATGCAMKLIPGYADQDVAQNLWVPITYRGITYRRPLQEEVVSWLRVSEDSSMQTGFAAFDVTIADLRGNVLLEVSQLRLRRLEEALNLQAANDDDVTTDAEGGAKRAAARKLSPGELALQHNATQGIRALEGFETLQTLLATPMPPELIVSSMELSELSAQLDSISQAAATASATKFDRPELDSDFEAPRNATEKTLAEIWGGLLGVDGIGIHDSFFDLGGHSLIAVRLFNEIADRFGADLPMSVLMSSPTIAGLAELVGDTGEADEATGEAAPAKAALQYEYVVPMHAGTVGGATPLFVVAGMFGNVLNLSHLAHLLGEERPFYAIQARGLYGNAQPHDSFEEMAADYIREVRKVQPEGPYLLGGFSGGGITAYEMARQLIAAGEQVHPIVLLDTPLPQISQFGFADRVAMFWQKLREGGVRFLIDKLQARRQWKKLQAEKARAHVPASTPGGHEFQSQRIGDAFMQAVRDYEMVDAPVDIALFRPKLNVEYRLSGGRMVNADREYIYPDNGWTPHVRSVQVFEVPGNHDSMVLEPNVRVLVARLQRALREADA